MLLDGTKQRIKVTDFGLSQSTDTQTHTTQSGGAAGTFAYMAPELMSEGIFTEKADVYSYGVVVWECVTCKHPSWSNVASMMQILSCVVMKNMRPPLTDEEEEATPAGVLELMRQCWDKDENARPTFSEVSQITSGLVRSGSTKTTFVSDSDSTLA